MAISRDQVAHIARLAHLDFSEAEQERFTREMNAILEYVALLDRLDTSAIEPTSHVEEGSRAWRDDHAGGSIPHDDALRNAPESGEGHFKVPRVMG